MEVAKERRRFRDCGYGLARRDQSTSQSIAWSLKHSETLGTRNDGWLSTRTHPTDVLARFAQMRASPPISNRNVAESNFPRPHRLSAGNVRFVVRTIYARRCTYRGIGETLQKERSILPGFPVRLFESRIYQKIHAWIQMIGSRVASEACRMLERQAVVDSSSPRTS